MINAPVLQRQSDKKEERPEPKPKPEPDKKSPPERDRPTETPKKRSGNNDDETGSLWPRHD